MESLSVLSVVVEENTEDDSMKNYCFYFRDKISPFHNEELLLKCCH